VNSEKGNGFSGGDARRGRAVAHYGVLAAVGNDGGQCAFAAVD
jgi:hypothetical protein